MDRAMSAEAIVEQGDHPLYVVTAGTADEVSGCLVGFLTQSSMTPARLLVCISTANHTFGVAERAPGLAVHALGADQLDTARHFGETTGDVMDKFAHVGWEPGITGAPVLTECAAWAEGRTLGRMPAGDHEAFLIALDRGGEGPRTGRLMASRATDLEAGHPG
jgi:flavin reductase (DIM6/NTAB) family NADH-FMN oxidoreductase RutF